MTPFERYQGLVAVSVVSSLATTSAIENVGVATGVPFGRYEFLVGRDLPRIGVVPVIVGPLYFEIGYPAWIIACLLVGSDVVGPCDRPSLFTIPVVAAFTNTQWDLVMDPPNATIERAWIWFDGGGYFGVPLSNVLGWFLTTWLFFPGAARSPDRVVGGKHPRCSRSPSPPWVPSLSSAGRCRSQLADAAVICGAANRSDQPHHATPSEAWATKVA